MTLENPALRGVTRSAIELRSSGKIHDPILLGLGRALIAKLSLGVFEGKSFHSVHGRFSSLHFKPDIRTK
jgi:hypothetical protein